MSGKIKRVMKNRIKLFTVLFYVVLVSLYATIATSAVTFDHYVGDGAGLSGPHDVDVDGYGNVIVADFHNGRMVKFASNGTFISEMYDPFGYPSGLVFDSNGNMLITDYSAHRLAIFDSNWDHVRYLGDIYDSGKLLYPYDMAIDSSGKIFVADSNHNAIKIFDQNYNYFGQFGFNGSGQGGFPNPAGSLRIAIDGQDNVYVSCWSNPNFQVQKFTNSGQFISSVAVNGSGDGQFTKTAGVAVDSAGNLYVADSGSKRIQIFDSYGNFLETFGTPGIGEGQFSQIGGISLNNNNEIFVAEYENNRISVLTPFLGVGPQGVQGKLGDTGPQGVQGKLGDTGAQGVQGKLGDTGAQGPQGKLGDIGPQGVQGKLGDTGAQGVQGKIGPAGADGAQGPQGDPGMIPAEVSAMQAEFSTMQSQIQALVDEIQFLRDRLPQVNRKEK